MDGLRGRFKGRIHSRSAAGYEQFLTFDMVEHQTDVALIKMARLAYRTENTRSRLLRCAHLSTGRCKRTLARGGGSLAFRPELTKALRVGPESSGALNRPSCLYERRS